MNNALVDRWRADAAIMNRYGASAAADVLLTAAADLESWLAERDEELLTPAQAAADPEVLYKSADHIGELLRTSRVKNRGKKHRPLVRRGDLPKAAAKEIEQPSLPSPSTPSLQAFTRRATANHKGR